MEAARILLHGAQRVLLDSRHAGLAAVADLEALGSGDGTCWRSVSDRRIGDEGIEQIAAFLETNSTLRELGLHYNKIALQVHEGWRARCA